jgi:glycerophosphoryl diester phosphodiesterase
VIAAYHSAGVEVHIWTINDPAEMTRLLDAGVDGLVSDRADIALEVLAKRRLASPGSI